MKQTLTVVALGMACLASVAQADTVNQNFSVNATLGAACLSNNVSAPSLNFGSYPAFGAATVTAPTATISFKCTRALPLTGVAFDTGSGAGVIAGLQYDLVASTATKTSGSAATTAAAGSADVYDYVITGSMGAGQAGCVSAGNAGDRCSATQTRTLTLTY